MQEFVLKKLAFNLESKKLDVLFETVFGQKLLENSLPVSIEKDFHPQKVSDNWIKTIFETKEQSDIRWPDNIKQQVAFYPRNRIWILLEKRVSIEELFKFLEEVPFEIASFRKVHTEWGRLHPPYSPPSFSNGHYPHGWACAFKGNGHLKVVSRRWLEYGPWKTIHLENDTTIIQFHDLSVKANVALQQAKQGHQLMGISDEGGFIHDNYEFEFNIKGLYVASEKLLKIPIHGRMPGPKELLDYSAAKLYNVLGDNEPIERVALIFMKEDEAKKYLQELWLRGLECWAILDGTEIRLDEDFIPDIKKPDWCLQ